MTQKRTAAVVTLAALVGAVPATAATPAQRETTAVCRTLVSASSVGIPARASGLDRLARLSVRLDAGVTPALERLRHRPSTVPDTAARRDTVALLKAWRDSARSELTASTPSPSAAGEQTRRDLGVRLALVLRQGATACPFPGHPAPATSPRARLALAFTAARLSLERPPKVWSTRRIAYGRAVTRAAGHGVGGATLARARSLGVVLDRARAAVLAKDASGVTEQGARLDSQGRVLVRALLGAGPTNVYAPTTDGPLPAGWVRVPRLSGGPATAYDAARAAGLRLAIPAAWSEGALLGADVRVQSPRAGTPAPRGAPVGVILGPGAVGSPTTITPVPTAVVPDFSAFTLAGVRQWSATTNIYWVVDYAPLPSTANGATLDANYRVGGQSPAAGQSIAQYQAVSSGGLGGGVQITPVHIAATVIG